MPARDSLLTAQRHWDDRFEALASLDARASSYTLANELYQRRYLNPLFGGFEVDWLEFVRARVAAEAPLERVLVLGCGIGDGLIDMHRRGLARQLHGVDLSESAIAKSRELAAQAGLSEVVTFQCVSFDALDLDPGSFDALFTIQSLHHSFDPLGTLQSTAPLLKRGGWLVANEYIGPNRWQFGWLQLLAIKGLLSVLPRRLRRRPDGSLKGRIGRPSLEWMLETDPSEAVQSEAIPQALASTYRIVETVEYGGGVTLPVLDEIIQNFRADRPEDLAWLDRVVRLERLLERRGWMRPCNALYLATRD